MKHSKANELIGGSLISYEDALNCILQRGNKTLRGIHTLDVLSKRVTITGAGEPMYEVRALLKFDMTAPDLLHL